MVPAPRLRWTQSDGTTSITFDAQRFQRAPFRMPTEQTPPGPVPTQQGAAANTQQGAAANTQQGAATSTQSQGPPATSGTSGAANAGAANAGAASSGAAGSSSQPTRRERRHPTGATGATSASAGDRLGQRNLNSLTVGELRAMHQAIDDALSVMMDEDDENLDFIPSKFIKKRRRGGPPGFRGQQRNQIINDVHKYAGELFGIPLGQTPATKAGVGALLPGPPENPDIAPPTGVENFRYAWNRPPTNLYNQAAATNFANAMVMSPRFPYVRAQFLELRATFLRYAGRTLKKAWEDKWLHPPNPTAVFSYRQGENARSRQYRLFHTRRGVTRVVVALRRHTELIDKLTAEGMSSDEEHVDPATGRRFLVAKKKWRSAELNEFLRVLDRLAVKLRMEKRGQPARVRVDAENRWSAAGPVYSLPRNAYLDSWVTGLADWQRELLDIQAVVYDFSFPAWVHEALATPDDHEMDERP